MRVDQADRGSNVTSDHHRPVIRFPWDDLTFNRYVFTFGYLGGMYTYAVSKLCNILFTLELSKRLKG